MHYEVTCIGDTLEDVFVEPDLKIRSDKAFLGGKSLTFEFGEKIPLNWVEEEIGGSACNAAVGFRRLGYKTGIIAMLGEDDPAEKVIKRLKSEGVDTEHLIIRKDAKTGYSVIFSIDSERTIFVFHGPRDYDKFKISKDLETDWIYISPLGNDTDELEARLVSAVSEKGVKLAWNPGSIQIKQGASHFRHLLKCTSVLFINREEGIKFLDLGVRPEPREVMRKLRDFGPRIVVMTNGKEGARAYDGKTFYDIDAPKNIKRVDSTGAGDSFAVGFLGRLASLDWKEEIAEADIQDALRWGVRNASSVLGHIGAQKGLLDRKKISC
jgi:sugar/nucleoside kinase (ribokinase family)